VKYCPTQALLASGGHDCTLRLWTQTADSKHRCILKHVGPVRCLDISADSKLLASGSDDKSVKLFSVHDLKFQTSLTCHKHWLRSVCFEPRGRLLGSGGDDQWAHVTDLESRKPVFSASDHKGAITCVRFVPRQDLFATASVDKKIKLYDLRVGGKLVQHYDAHDDVVNEVSIHPSGNFMLSCSDDAHTKVWDIRSGLLAYTLFSHVGEIKAATFSTEGFHFATGGADTKTMHWSTEFVAPERPVEVKPHCNWCEEKKLTKPASTGTKYTFKAFSRNELLLRPGQEESAVEDEPI
jgi:centriolar protein POC1